LGFIGSYLCKYIIRKNEEHTIVGIARNSNQKHLKRLEDVLHNPRFTLIYKDIGKDIISDVFEDVDCVFHTAARTFVDYSVVDPQPFIEDNIIGSYKMLEAARKSNVKKYFQLSTDECYGPIGSGSWKEDSPLNPTNPYSMSKACADMIALTYHKTYGLPVIITRAENVYGPYQHPQKVIPAWTKRALEGKPLLIYGDGKHKRMWLHVEDNIRALLFLLEHGKAGEIYNIAGEEEMENNELAQHILKIVGRSTEGALEYIPDEKIRPFHDRRYALNVEKLKSLGWKRKYTLDEGLKNVVLWYVMNRWWLY
jgi:dTDP-glucose 4,6-dehydratase